MTATTASSAPVQRPSWIVSPWWDLAYVVVTPILIVPIVLIVARRWLTPEEVSLAVIAFASLGHHLPGFMRAYGDRELFRRYRSRFLLVPLLVFALALLFSPPSSLARALHLPWTHLHGLELILLLWGTWHGLMQTYGFMRIYDVRLGVNDRWSARLDHWLCLSVFVAGVVFSDARAFGVANAMWQSGLPLFGPEWLAWTRLIVGSVGVCVLVAYAVNLVRRHRLGLPVSWLKLLLIGTTGWFYWFTGRLSTNVLIGLAMFEIYHAVQYYAIVWVYNRRLFQRAGERFGPLRFLFQDRWSMLGIYLAAIAAYGSIRYFNIDANEYVFVGGSLDAHQWLVALFVTSSFLHFYFDGFIWKVSEKKTQQNLVDQVPQNLVAEHYVPGILHTAKWGLLLAIAGGLLWAERSQSSDDYKDLEHRRSQALLALAPELPECQAQRSRDALVQGDSQAAVDLAEKAFAQRPRSFEIRMDLCLAYMENEQLKKAISLAQSLGADRPKHWQAHLLLGSALSASGENELAISALQNASQLRPRSAEVYYQLGVAEFQRGAHAEAITHLTHASEIAPKHFEALFQLANVYYTLGKPDEALDAYARCQELRPQHPQLCANLGGLLAQLGRTSTAEKVYRAGLAANPDAANLNFNLGILLWQQGEQDEARRLILRAEALGIELPEDVRAAIILGQ